MEEYLVGGAVRDALLGLEARERDWVVVGSSPEAMGARGFRPVGKDFPVFLHPRTNEEYALARRERKSGHGYGGFVFHTGSDVTLEEDLSRRDLTVNAMARAADGTLIDPYGGQRDLAARVLRHVSPAFVEDPLRVLRVARFAARFHPLGFSVAPETLALMRELVASGELAHLAHERVWTEIERALGEPAPEEFVRVLRECNALAVLLPEVDRLWGVPQPPKHHPEVDTGEHLLLALRMAARMGIGVAARFALLLHDVGKGLTPPAEWPRHIAHEARGEPLARAICERLRAPRRMRELAVLVCRQHTRAHRACEMRAATLVTLLDDLDAWRQPQRFEEFLDACEADARGRAGLEERPYEAGERLRRAYLAARDIDASTALARGLRGPAVGAEIHRLRCAAVRACNAEESDD